MIAIGPRRDPSAAVDRHDALGVRNVMAAIALIVRPMRVLGVDDQIIVEVNE
ncbi:hypothetical protein [Rhodopseudomonas sp. P2A-2r]|uniref:hypothetical protein n=1 Tax=Rhodopseudomonas sp. P2A-2r TaxID=2991972 RepID=UPI0029FEEAFF|nr:hypothetical protein [Rhodopseudomonas sp. P2A-2r]